MGDYRACSMVLGRRTQRSLAEGQIKMKRKQSYETTVRQVEARAAQHYSYARRFRDRARKATDPVIGLELWNEAIDHKLMSEDLRRCLLHWKDAIE